MTNESILISEVIPASPQRIFSAWMDSAEHSAFTGDEATVVPEVGGEHRAAGGYIQGRTLELNEGSRIVQSWRTTEFPPESPDSRVEITLEPTLGGTLVTLLHTDIPVGQGDRYRQGWNEYYLSRLKTYFADTDQISSDLVEAGGQDGDDDDDLDLDADVTDAVVVEIDPTERATARTKVQTRVQTPAPTKVKAAATKIAKSSKISMKASPAAKPVKEVVKAGARTAAKQATKRGAKAVGRTGTNSGAKTARKGAKVAARRGVAKAKPVRAAARKAGKTRSKPQAKARKPPAKTIKRPAGKTKSKPKAKSKSGKGKGRKG